MTEGIPFQLERRLLRRDGSILWANVSVSPIMDATGKPLSAVGVEVDITARKRAEKALLQLNLQLESRVEKRTAELQVANQALQENRRRLQVLSQRLVQVQEEERRAIARELHDRVGQSLIALNLNLTIILDELSKQETEQLRLRLTDSINLTTAVIVTVRDVMSNLRPTVLDDYGLEGALKTILDEFKSRYGINIVFEKPSSPIQRLDTSIEMTLFRITQEALFNIVRHAHAGEAILSLWEEDAMICLSIQDNGVGTRDWQKANRPGNHGLTIMRERAQAVDGDLRVSSIAGKGTKIEVRIPLPDGSQSESTPKK
jgi:signal transduction histidine kinase